MAKKQPRPQDDVIHVCEFSGIAYVKSGTGRDEVPFKLPGVKIKEKHLKNSNPLSLFVSHLAPALMPKLLPQYLGLARYDLTDCQTPPGFRKHLMLMNRAELEDYVADNEIEVFSAMYPQNDQLREAIKEYEKDPASFVANQKRQQENYGDALVCKNELLELNNSVDIDNAALQGKVAPDKVLYIDTDDGPKPIVKPSETPVPAKDLVGTKSEPSLTESAKMELDLTTPVGASKGKAEAKADDLEI